MKKNNLEDHMAKRWKKKQKIKNKSIGIDAYISKNMDIDLDKMTKEFQKNLKDSEIYKELVKKYGKKKADEIISQCKAQEVE